MNSPVESWLSKYWQKTDVSEDAVQAIKNAAAESPESLYTALSAIGINVKKGKRPEFEKVRMPELLQMIQEDTRSKALNVTGTQSHIASKKPPALTRSIEGSESARLREAIDEAVSLGIVREEIFPSDAQSPRDVYILSSSHYGNHDYDPTVTPHETKASQVQLFQLLQLLKTRNTQSPVFVEGRTFGMGYDKPMATHWRQQGIDLENSEVQSDLFHHPKKLIALFDTHQRISEKTGCSTPVFYEYSTYKHIAGAHTPQTSILLENFFTDWMPWYQAFEKKYEGLRAQWRGLDGSKIKFSVGTGWQGDVPLLELAGEWFYADDVKQDCLNYFRYAEMLEQVDTARESDVSMLMQRTKHDLTPMAFMGLGHTLRTELHLRPWARTHVLTPMASTHMDKKRSTKKASDAESPILQVANWQTMYRIACNIPPLKR